MGEDIENLESISVVIPILNEEGNIKSLYPQLKQVLDGLGREYELIFVDDGSIDGTFPLLKEIAAQDDKVKIIRFRKNFGQTAAISAGFDYATGDIIITSDGDLQNDPEDIPKLIAKVEEGYDVVSGWRKDRKEPFLTRILPSKIANSLISFLTDVKLHDYGCSLKAYRREVVKNINLYGEMHRFIPALASWMGISVAEVPVNDRARKFGKSKYGLSRTTKVLLDLITVKFLLRYSTRPIQIFGFLGLISTLVGFLMALYLSYGRLFKGQSLANRPILLLAVLLIFIGIQLITMGLLGEMIVRIYHEAQGKPIYVVRELIEGKKRTGYKDKYTQLQRFIS